MKQKKVTFADIAAYTGFSKTTISRYFNNPDSLTLENQEKIAHALDVLGYQENKLAKVLANGKSEFVGIIIPNLYLHYYSEMLNQLLSTYEKYNYKFLVFIGNNKKEIEEKYIHELMAYKIEGLIVLIPFRLKNLLLINSRLSRLSGNVTMSVACLQTTIWVVFRQPAY